MLAEIRTSPNFLGFDIPEELIARYPLKQRDASNLLIGKTTEILPFTSITEQLSSGDLLILNDTKVQPARLSGYKKDSLGKVSFLIVEVIEQNKAYCLYKSSHAFKQGQIIICGTYKVVVVSLCAAGQAIIEAPISWYTIMEEQGQMPLPPYMKRQSTDDDKQRYQSIWAKELGSSAAPTASLHFTPEVLAALQAKGVQTAFCTLHVGLGTFFPVHHSNLEEHVMHEEWFCVPSQTRQAIAATKKSGHHVVAVGTTVMRALESLPDKSEETYQGTTQLFIKPGFEFRFVDKLLTNFHQVDSTLMLLVQAFAGHDTIDACYKKAIAAKMRFYSYGDCMLLERSI